MCHEVMRWEICLAHSMRTFSVFIFENNYWTEIICLLLSYEIVDIYFKYIDELKSLHRAFKYETSEMKNYCDIQHILPLYKLLFTA